jgi:hypothetical protein
MATPAPSLRTRLWWLWLIILTLLAYSIPMAVTALRLGTIAPNNDDGFIYLTYVREATAGHLFQYNSLNHGEYTTGMTGLSWYLVQIPLAFIIRLLTGNPNLAALLTMHIAAASCLAGVSILLFKLTRLKSESWLLSTMAVLALATGSFFMWGIYSGLENPLASLLLMSVVYLLVTRSDLKGSIVSGLLAGLLTLTRPETIAINLAFGFIWLGNELFARHGQHKKSLFPRRGIKPALVFLGISLAIYLCGSLVYYLVSGVANPSSYGTRFFVSPSSLQPYTLLINSVKVFFQNGPFSFIPVALLILAPVMKRELRMPIVWLAAAILVRCLMGLYSWYFYRYFSWTTPVIIFSVLVSLQIFIDIKSVKKKLQTLFFIATIIFLMSYYYPMCRSGFYDTVKEIQQTTVAAGKWIAENTPQDAVIASEPMGAVGFYCQRETVDIMGLTTKDTRGTFGDWDFTFQYMQERRVSYLLYYELPAPYDSYVIPVKDFYADQHIIVPSDHITLYKIDWELYNKSSQ